MNNIVRKDKKGISQPLDQSDEIYLLKNFQETLLNTIDLRGISNIKKVIMRKILDEVVKNITGKERQDIHLFVNQKPGVSFKPHCDDKDVYLYVVKGKKKVNMNNEVKPIYDDEGIIIEKGVQHFVESEADTWGLSIGVI